MPKTPKKGAEQASDASIEAEELLDQLRASLLEGARALHGRILAIAKKLQGAKYNQKDASHLAWLTKQAAQVMGEVRKLDEAERKRLQQLTPALVLAWLRQLDASERARILREAEGQEARGSGLA